MEQLKSDDEFSKKRVTLLFVEDLLSYFMKMSGFKWKPVNSLDTNYYSVRHIVETVFSVEIGRAVLSFPVIFKSELNGIVDELTPWFLADACHFRRFVYYLSDKIFAVDLFLEMIMFFGCVASVCYHLARIGYPEFLDQAILHIDLVFHTKLKHNFETLGGWDIFRIYCIEFADKNLLPKSDIYDLPVVKLKRKRKLSHD